MIGVRTAIGDGDNQFIALGIVGDGTKGFSRSKADGERSHNAHRDHEIFHAHASPLVSRAVRAE